MSGLTGFNVGYSNTFGGDNSYLDISYIFNPRTSSTNVTNTNMFYKQSGAAYTDISNVFLKSSTNGVTGISYEIIAVTKLYDPLSNNYADIGDLFQPYYNDISFSNITSTISPGLIIYKYINGVKFINSGNASYTGRFRFPTPLANLTGKFTINFACVGGGGGSNGGGGGGGSIIIGSADMSYNFLYYFGVGDGLKGTGGNTFFRATQTSNDMSYNFMTNGGAQGGGTSTGNGGAGGSVQINIKSGILSTINYISSGGGGGGGYDTSGNSAGAGGDPGGYTINGSPTILAGGVGQPGSACILAIGSSVNYVGGNGGGNYDASGSYLSFNSIPDQVTNYFGGGGGGNSYVPTPGPSYDGFPSNYPTNTWIQGGSGATTSSGSSSINTTQYGGGAGASRIRGTTGSAGSGYLLFWWNYPLT
jgi:hypothetical protein